MSVWWTAAIMASQVFSQIDLDGISIELERPSAEIRLVPATLSTPVQLAILDGYQLRLHLGNESPTIINLPTDTNALDLFDENNDGRIEVLAVRGNQVGRLNPDSEWTLLFEASSELGRFRGLPRLYPIIRREPEGFVCSLPRKSAVEYRTFDGRVVREIPYDREENSNASVGSTFTRRLVDPPQLGNANAIEYLVTARDYRALSGTSDTPQPPDGRRGTLRQLREAAGKSIEHWPWMPLRHADPDSGRVHYALEPPAFRNTMISTWDLRRPSAQSPSTPGPKRRYPGIIIPPSEGSFDVDHDGHNDLLLWNSPLPGRSLRRLLGIATRTTWPLRLSIHPYRPERGLYRARPIAQVKLDIPAHWFLSLSGASPLRNLVMTDLNGDGLDDLGFSADEKHFEIRSAKSNFSEKESYRFPLPVTKLKLEAIARGQHGRPGVIVLRGDLMLYVIRTPKTETAATN